MRPWIEEACVGYKIPGRKAVNPISEVDGNILDIVCDILLLKGEMINDLRIIMEAYKSKPDSSILSMLESLKTDCEEGLDTIMMVSIGDVTISAKQIKTIKLVDIYDGVANCKIYYVIINGAEGNTGIGSNQKAKFFTSDERDTAINGLKELMEKMRYKFVVL